MRERQAPGRPHEHRMTRLTLVLALLWTILPGPTRADPPIWRSPLALGPADATSVAARAGLLLAGGRTLQKVSFGGELVTLPGPRRPGLFVSRDRGRTWFLGEEVVVGDDGVPVRTPIDRTPGLVGVSPTDGFAFFGTEVWRSTDEGTTWARTAQMPSAPSTFDALPDGRLVMGFAAGGLRVSTDRGGTWAPLGSGLPAAQVNEVLPVSASLLLVGTQAGLYRSADGGLSFAPSTRGLRDDDLSVLGLAGTVDSGIFLGAAGVSTTEMYWSPDLGETWIARGPIYSENLVALIARGGLELIRHNGTVGPPGFSLIAGAYQGLFRSSVIISTGDRQLSAPGIVWTRHDPEPGAATIHDVAVETDLAPGAPGDRAYVSVRYGSVFVTGAVPGHWTAPGWYDELHWGRICGGLDPQGGGVLVAACGGHIMRSTDDGATWQPAGNGLVYSNLGSPDKPWKPLVRGPDGTMYTSGQESGLFRADPEVRSWTKVATYPAPSVAAMAVAPADPDRLFVAGLSTNGAFPSLFWLSKDGGRTWAANPDLGRITYAVAVTPLAPNRVLVADFGDGGWISEDAGDTWTRVTLPPGEAGFVDAWFSPLDARLAWGHTQGNRLIRSTDGGRTWELARQDKLVGIYRVYPSPWDAETLYFETTTQGIHVSRDGGQTILPLADGLPKLGAQFSYQLRFAPDEPGVLWVTTGASVGQSFSPLNMWVYRGVDPEVAGGPGG